MSKEQSTIIKGIAILMMLWYHLFGISDLESLCTPLLYIHGKSFAAYIANACYPVSFFLILSGYGLTYIYHNKLLTANSQSKRLLKLYIHYWVVLFVFVSIGHYINPAVYPNDLLHFVANIIGIRCTYNGETWFLLPYAVISLCSYWITVYWVQLSFYFSLGILLYRLLENEPIQLKSAPTTIYFIVLCLIFIIKSQFKITLADGLYAFVFIFCFLHLRINQHITSFLYRLGHRSMPMWMTHTFYSVYLFPDFIYGFKYPLLIFTVLVIVSYIIAIPIMRISKKIINIIKL